MKKLDSFLKIKMEDWAIDSTDLERSLLYRDFYDDISNENLTDFLSHVHSRLNNLLSFMNSKNNVGNGGHYNAAESRELMFIINEISIILVTLEKQFSDYSYEIHTYYKKTLDCCLEFLKSSGGSTIPNDFPLIEIINTQPIFLLKNSVQLIRKDESKKVSLNLIGNGSYARVFSFIDSNYNLELALKRANSELDEQELLRFKLEFDELNKLDSPYIIKVYSYNENSNEYIMELVDQTLEDFMRYNNQSLLPSERIAFVRQLVKGFNYIHSKGLLHRDISYRNVLVKIYDDGTRILKISDFGLVKVPMSSMTRQDTEIKGALNDLSDLSRVGFGEYNIEHETYAFSKLVYFILTGKQSNYHKETNSALKSFIMKATSSNNSERFKSVNEIYKHLVESVFPQYNDILKNN